MDDSCNQSKEAARDSLHKKVKDLFDEYKVHYETQGKIAAMGATSLWEVADLWTDKADCKAKSGKEAS